jgi:superfamily II DNA or RNA helicase
LIGPPSIFYRARHRFAQRVSPLHEPCTRGVALKPLDEPQRGVMPHEVFTFDSAESIVLPLLSCCALRELPLLDKPARTQDFLSYSTLRTAAVSLREILFLDVINTRLPLLSVPFIRDIAVTLPTPDTADSTPALEDALCVSSNLFKPLGRLKSDGKRYGKDEQACRGEQQRFPFSPNGHGQESNYKLSYIEQRREDGGLSRQGLSIWDSIFPLLQPPPFDVASQQAVILPGELEPHQPAGVKFLASQAGALLADGVQTGKTIQAIVAMKLLFQCGKIKSGLVIAPISVLKHWQDRLADWAPELWQRLTVVRSPNKDKRQVMWAMPAHVHVTNYETVVGDLDLILRQRGDKGYGLVIADEIQRIKNASTDAAKAVKELGARAAYRWGLSATPIEGSLDDLVSIFEFLRPGLLRRGIETELSASKKIAPYFLRRRTQDIAKLFKEPRYDEYRVEMEGRQLDAYHSAYQESVAELRKLGEKVTLAHALSKLQELKQLCNVDLVSKESAKLNFLMDWLEDIVASGNKVLVFSQYRKFGMDFLAEQLKRFGCIHYGLATTDRQKQASIQSFRDEKQKSVFIANPATAGTGLPDLKIANYVFHFDHWWNPAREDQANGRILGIGQKKDAFIAHVWVENSIEGRIEAILARKRELFDRVIDAKSSAGGTGLSTEEVFGLFGLEPPMHLRSGKPADRDSGGKKDTLANISPREMEFLVERLYRVMGYSARVTPQSRDGGVDVVALQDTPSGREKLAIQCKHQTGTVGREVLQKLLGVIAADPSYSAGVVVTSAEFSGDAKQFAQQNGRLRLVDKNELARLLVQNRVPIREQK